MKFNSNLIRIFFFFGAAAVISWQSRAMAAQLQLSWVDNSTDESGFNIERKSGTTGTYAQIASVGANVISYTDSSLTNSTTYCYRVNAFNTAGTSPYSPEVCATTPATIQTFSVAITKTGTGTGTVSSAPSGINCGSTCSGTFNSGAVVALSASAGSGSVFAGWSGDADCSDGSLTMSASRSCTATFNLQTSTANTISTNIVNNVVLSGSSVLWTATPTGSPIRVEFLIDGSLKWSETTTSFQYYQYNGDPSGVLNTTTLSNATHQLKVRAVYADNSTAEKSITVTVSNTTTQQFALTANVVKTITGSGTGNGTVTSTPAGINNCSSTCSASYNSGTTVNLTATPGSGSTFGGWTGCTNGVVTLTANTACTATFNPIAPQTYILSIIKSGTGNGTVTTSPSGINCGSTCSATYNSGTAVTLTPAPASGSTFAGWSGTGCGSGTVTMTANMTCTASFQPAVNQLQSRIGVFRPNTGEWFLDDDGNGQWNAGDIYIKSFGHSGDLPVVGSWSGKGVSNIGTFTSATGMWQLDTNGDGVLDCSLDACVGPFGQSGDFPVTREMGGATGSIIGTYTPETTVKINGRNKIKRGHWRFDNNDNRTFDGCSIDQCDTFSIVGEIPIIGDWNGTGIEQIALFTSKNGTWYFDRNGNEKWDGCTKDKCLGQFGTKGDLPIVGDWDGTGKIRIGVFRPSTAMWYLDLNGNGRLDTCDVDACIGPFGQSGDLPVVGKW
jgi:hypothetical protein